MKRLLTFALLSAIAFGLVSFGVNHGALAQLARDVWGNPVRNSYQPPNLAPVRLFLIALSGGAGFALGWFLSPQAAAFRRMITIILMAVVILTATIDNGVLGWGLTPFVCLAAFMMGLGHWARGFVHRLLARIQTRF
jgi:type IV secretion system protein VirD4